MPEIQVYQSTEDSEGTKKSPLLEVTGETDSSNRVLLHTKPILDTVSVMDIRVRDMLQQILKELQILNSHQELITDEKIRENEIER